MHMVLAVVFGFAFAAHGSPITYTLSGNFSGSLGSTSFSEAFGTFTFVGDSSNVTNPTGNFPANTNGNSSFKLTGKNAATFVNSTFGVESEYGAASFMDLATGFAIGEYNESTPSDVLSVYGPAISGVFVSYGPTPESTSLGDLTITGATGDVTFQAAQPVLTAATPEPESLLLTGTGVLSVAGVLRQRRRRA